MPPPLVYRSVFLSYSHADAGAAHAVHEQLSRYGVTVWLDNVELAIGDSLERRITQAISDYDLLFVLISRASAASAWVRREIGVALAKERALDRVCVIPLSLDKMAAIEGLEDRVGVTVTANGIPPDRLRSALTFLRHEDAKIVTAANCRRFLEHFRRADPQLDAFFQLLAQLDLPYAMVDDAVAATRDPIGLAEFAETLAHVAATSSPDASGDEARLSRETIGVATELAARVLVKRAAGEEVVDRLLVHPEFKPSRIWDQMTLVGDWPDSAPARLRLLIRREGSWRHIYFLVDRGLEPLQPVLDELVSHIVSSGQEPIEFKMRVVEAILLNHSNYSQLETLLDLWIERYRDQRWRRGLATLRQFYGLFARGYETESAPIAAKLGRVEGRLKTLCESDRMDDVALTKDHLQALKELESNQIGGDAKTFHPRFFSRLRDYLSLRVNAPEDAEASKLFFELQDQLSTYR